MVDLLGYAALAISLAGWISYVPVSKVHSLRRTMWPVWAILLLGALLGIGSISFAFLSRNYGFGLLGAMGALASLGLFVIVYLVMLLVPGKAGRPEINQALPRVGVVCPDGQRRVIREIVPQGPVLIVFFRGFW